MHSKHFASPTRLLLATLVAATLVALTGCGPSLTGVYVGTAGNSVYDKIELQGGGKAIVTMIGMSHEGTFKLDGKKLQLSNGAQTFEMSINDKGCLVDALGGTYCKDGSAPASASNSKPSSSGGGMTGTYEAKGLEGRAMTITFVSATNFTFALTQSGGNPGGLPAGMSPTMPGTYEVRGDHVLLTMMGETEALDLTRKGNSLEGTLDGDKLKFVKK